MVADEIGQQLHDKATRGGTLTRDEQGLIEAWYSRHDAEEMALLARSQIPEDLEALRAEVEAGMARLVTLAQRIQRQARSVDQFAAEARTMTPLESLP